MDKFEDGQLVWGVLYTDDSMPYTELLPLNIAKSFTYKDNNFCIITNEINSEIEAVFPTKNEAIDYIIKKWESLKDKKEAPKKYEYPSEDHKKMCDAAGFYAMSSIGGFK